MNANIRKLKITFNDFHSYFNDSFFMYKFSLNLLKYSFRNDKVKPPHNIEKIEIKNRNHFCWYKSIRNMFWSMKYCLSKIPTIINRRIRFYTKYFLNIPNKLYFQIIFINLK